MEQSTAKKILLLLVFLLIIVGIVYLLAGGNYLQKKTQDDTAVGGGVKVDYVNLNETKDGADKLPKGLPAGIPIETEEVTESYTANYQDPLATQYTVTFRTSKSVDAKYKEYVDYLTAEGYQISEGDKNAPVKTLQATKANDDFLAVISKQGSYTQVQLGYLDRP